MSEPSVSITAEPFGSPDAQRLISALDAELGALYPPEQRFGPNAKADHFKAGSGTFLMARAAGRAVGCGGVRLLDATTAEVKRMYVEPAHRGTGLGRAVLSALETAAQQMGVRRTGSRDRYPSGRGDRGLSPRRLHPGRLLGRVCDLAVERLFREEPVGGSAVSPVT